jgi:hypothetical protein
MLARARGDFGSALVSLALLSSVFVVGAPAPAHSQQRGPIVGRVLARQMQFGVRVRF